VPYTHWQLIVTRYLYIRIYGSANQFLFTLLWFMAAQNTAAHQHFHNQSESIPGLIAVVVLENKLRFALCQIK